MDIEIEKLPPLNSQNKNSASPCNALNLTSSSPAQSETVEDTPPSVTPPSQEQPDDLNPGLIIKSNRNGHIYTFRKSTWTFHDVFTYLADLELLEPNKTKIIIKGKQYRFERDSHRLVCDYNGMKGSVFGTNQVDLQYLQASHVRAMNADGSRRLFPGSPRGQPGKPPQYRFHDIRTLDWLPNSNLAQEMLEKLRDDYGIRRIMEKHHLEVKLLTEMEPLSNTSQNIDGGITRLLGLNRNNGDVIELRLRTDNHRGFRDFKIVRKTLCHELAHNRHSKHDSAFWSFCGLLEKESDATNSFRRLDGSHGIVADISRLDYQEDVPSSEWRVRELGPGVVMEREMRAKAAERRMRQEKEKEAGKDGNGQDKRGTGK